MARDTSKDVTHQQSMSKLSEKSKQTSASLLNSTKATPKALADSGEMDGVLGQIYQLMVDNRKDELAQRVIEEKYKKTDTGKEEQRHQELLKALTVRRRPKPKRVIRREKKAEEKEAAKPTEPAKPTAPAKKPAETAKKPPEQDKKPAETAKKPPEPAKKPPEPAKKPPEPAKKPAEDTAKKAAEDKAKKTAEDKAKKEAEAKKTAEQVKPPEVKPPKAEQVKPPEVKPPPKAEAAPAAPKPDQVKPPPKAEQVKPPPKMPAAPITGGSKGLVIAALVAAGFTSKAVANVLANVDKESGFKPRSEELEKYSAKTLFKMYGPPGVDGGQPEGGKNKVRFQTIGDAQQLVTKGPEAVGDIIYGGRMGNDKPGDGAKYVGRGYIQLTGKDAYKAISKMMFNDDRLVKNPELANDPKIAADMIPVFMKWKKYSATDLENVDKSIQAIGSANEKSRQERKKLAAEYNTKGFGDDIDSASKNNKDMKSQEKSSPPPIQQNTTNVNNTTESPAAPAVNDRPKHDRK